MSTTAALRRGIGAVCVSALVITCAAGVAQADPAPADPGPVISTVDTSTPGHATGTVSTDRPYVLVQLGTTSIESDAEPVVDGTASFDLPTWGFDSTTIRAVGCTSTDPASCDTETKPSHTVFARDGCRPDGHVAERPLHPRGAGRQDHRLGPGRGRRAARRSGSRTTPMPGRPSRT